MNEVKVVVAHSERATLRVGDVFLKVDTDLEFPRFRGQVTVRQRWCGGGFSFRTRQG